MVISRVVGHGHFHMLYAGLRLWIFYCVFMLLLLFVLCILCCCFLLCCLNAFTTILLMGFDAAMSSSSMIANCHERNESHSIQMHIIIIIIIITFTHKITSVPISLSSPPSPPFSSGFLYLCLFHTQCPRRYVMHVSVYCVWVPNLVFTVLYFFFFVCHDGGG